MTVRHKKSHVEEAKANLVSQFRGKRVLEGVIASYVEHVQELEDVFFALQQKRTLAEAEGALLDGLGSIVGEARESRTDDDYRLAIRARIILNLGNGTPEDVIGLIRALVGDKKVEIAEHPPAHFDALVAEPIDVDPFRVSRFVQSAKPAGVRGIFLWQQTENPFGFEGDPHARGFDDGSDQPNAGPFAGAADF